MKYGNVGGAENNGSLEKQKKTPTNEEDAERGPYRGTTKLPLGKKEPESGEGEGEVLAKKKTSRNLQ